jgi:uncharacterized membrane protein
MEIETAIEINATPDRVWDVMKDVERWPEWTDSISRVSLDAGEPKLGARAKIKQPRFPTMTWKVTQLEPGRGFAWVSSGPGYETVATHAIEATAAGSKVTLSVKQTGWMSHLMPWVSAISRRYVEMEAGGLKQRSEALAQVA